MREVIYKVLAVKDPRQCHRQCHRPQQERTYEPIQKD